MRFSIQTIFRGKCINEIFIRFTNMESALKDVNDFMSGWNKVSVISDPELVILVRVERHAGYTPVYINKEGFTTIPFNWS